MALVRGHDPYVGVLIGEQSAFGTPVVPALQLPIISESLTLNRDIMRKSQEFGNTGAQEVWEVGRSISQGSIVCAPKYNLQAFNILLAHAMGDEVKDADRWIEDETSITNVNRHAYQFATSLPAGLTIRIWKGGSVNGSSAYYEQFSDLICTGFVWEQPNDSEPRVTFNFIGAPSTYAAIGSNSLPAVQTAGIVPFLYRDMSNTAGSLSKFHFGSVITPTTAGLTYQVNFTSFRLTVDRHLDPDTAFCNSPDTLVKPGPSETRDVVLEVQSLLEDNYLASEKLATHFYAKTASKANIVYSSATIIGASARPYSMRFDFPNVRVEYADPSLKEPGPEPVTFRIRALNGATATPNTGSHLTATDFRIITACGDGTIITGGDADGTFSTL